MYWLRCCESEHLIRSLRSTRTRSIIFLGAGRLLKGTLFTGSGTKGLKQADKQQINSDGCTETESLSTAHPIILLK